MDPSTEVKWLRVAAIIPATAMAFMDQSILPVALPTIQQEFNAGSSALQWTVNVYLLGMAVFILMGGKLADRVGHRKSFLWGMGLFALFSAFCSLSPNIGFLIAARGLQGIGAAIMFPSQTSLIATSFPPSARGRATGLVVSMGSIFAVIGPVIGGILTEYLSWRWIFWINLPLTLAGILLTLTLIPPVPGRPGKVDLWGFSYFFIFAMATTTLFMQAQDWGWSSGKILTLAAMGIASLFFLIWREKKALHPFLNIQLFKIPIFSSVNVTIAITQFIMMITVFRIIYTEQILGYTPSQTGLIISIACMPILFFSYLGGFLSDKVSPKLPVALGYFFLVLSFFWIGWDPTPSLSKYFGALLLFGMGVPLMFTPSYSMTMSVIDKKELGIAFGLVATSRMFAGTIGLSIMHLFISIEKRAHISTLGERGAEILAFSRVHYLLGVLMIVASIAAFFLSNRQSAHKLPDAPADGWD